MMECDEEGNVYYYRNYFREELHNINGPAVIFNNGMKSYFIKGRSYNNFIEYIKDSIKYRRIIELISSL